MSTPRRIGGSSLSSTASTNTCIVRGVSAKFKAILIQEQACRLKFTRRANDTVWLTYETLGCPPTFDLFDIAAP